MLGVLSSGQVCGRINIVSGRRDRTEQLIKAIWLPDSINLLALLTTRSVQVRDDDVIFFDGRFVRPCGLSICCEKCQRFELLIHRSP